MVQLDRRQFISTAAMGLAALTLNGASHALTPPSLREAAAGKGLLFGTALRAALWQDKPYQTLVAEQCSLVVPEGALKWDTLRPAPDRFDFSGGDAYLKFAKENHMKYRGHTLVWHEALPSWFASTVNSGNAKKFMLDHISKVVGRYAGQMYSWDVVNEIMEPHDRRPDGLRKTPWLEMLGPEYIEIAFRAAHEADPKALLFYNEDQLHPETPQAEMMRQKALLLFKDLLKRNVPIHGLGLESHIFSNGPMAGEGFQRFLHEISDMGLLITVSEMDVCDQTFPADVMERDQLVAKKYHDYLSVVLQFPTVAAVSTWGLSDRYTWLSMHNPRKDGLPVRPLPFDSDLHPKKASEAIHQVLSEVPARSNRIHAINRLSA